MNIQELYTFCKEKNVLDYEVITVYHEIHLNKPDVEMIENVNSKSLIKNNEDHKIYIESWDVIYFIPYLNKYERVYNRNTEQFEEKTKFHEKSMTMEELFKWGKDNNCLDYEIYAEPIEATSNNNTILEKNYVVFNKNKQRIELNLN